MKRIVLNLVFSLVLLVFASIAGITSIHAANREGQFSLSPVIGGITLMESSIWKPIPSTESGPDTTSPTISGWKRFLIMHATPEGRQKNRRITAIIDCVAK